MFHSILVCARLLSVCVYIHLVPVCLSVCDFLSVFMSVCLSVGLDYPVYLSISFCPSVACAFVCLSVTSH